MDGSRQASPQPLVQPHGSGLGVQGSGLGVLEVPARSSRATSSCIRQEWRCHIPQDCPASFRLCRSGSPLLSSAQEKGTVTIPLISTCPYLPGVSPCHSVHTCGLRTLNQNHLGNLLKMQILPPGFLTHMVRNALEAVFSTSSQSVVQPHLEAAGLKLEERLAIRVNPNSTSSLLRNPEQVASPL